MNKITLTGRLTKDPELKRTQSGIAFANFTIAVDRPGSKKDDKIVDFFDCTVWGKADVDGRAGAICKYFHKGDGIVVTGTMQSNKKQDKDGNNRVYWGVHVDDFEFPIAKKSDSQQPEGAKPDGTFTEVSSGDLPF